MSTGLVKSVHNRILCCILLVFVFAAELISSNEYVSFSGSTQSDISCESAVKSSRGLILDSAVVNEITLTNQLNSFIQIDNKKDGRIEKNAIRLNLISLLLSFAFPAIQILLWYFSDYFESQRQRYSIISFIHNKDGRKDGLLSFI